MEKIIKKLKNISENGSIKDFEYVYNFIDDKNISVKNLAISILYDIKDIKLIILIGNKLKENISNEKRILLLSICWQSSLDFSEYFEIFIDDATKDSILMTIEAMSAIENMIENNKLNTARIEKSIIKLEKILPKLTGDKLLLINELVSVLNKV
jgi:hypothetical protein